MPGSKNMTGKPLEEVDPSSVASVDELLDELNLESYDGDEVKDETLSDEDLKSLEVDEIVSESYDKTPTASKKKKPKTKPKIKAKLKGEPAIDDGDMTDDKPKKAKKPKAERDLSLLPVETFILEGAPEDIDKNKADVLKSRPIQKKIGEKFDNLFVSIAAGRKPSTFVLQCLDLVEKHVSISSTELMAAMRLNSTTKGENYNEKTAASQVGQIMVLFNTLKIATRDGNKLTLNKKSVIARKINKIISA